MLKATAIKKLFNIFRYYQLSIKIHFRYYNFHGLLVSYCAKDKLQLDIPDSTVRRLRAKYVARQSQERTDQVNGTTRGRPVTLGRHDQTVQQCIHELVRSGEKVNSFVAIATARQVSRLMTCNT